MMVDLMRRREGSVHAVVDESDEYQKRVDMDITAVNLQSRFVRLRKRFERLATR